MTRWLSIVKIINKTCGKYVSARVTAAANMYPIELYVWARLNVQRCLFRSDGLHENITWGVIRCEPSLTAFCCGEQYLTVHKTNLKTIKRWVYTLTWLDVIRLIATCLYLKFSLQKSKHGKETNLELGLPLTLSLSLYICKFV